MAILAYVGLMGSGKSYSAVEHQIMPALKSGRRVVTNIPMVQAEVQRAVPGAQVIEFPLEVVKAEPSKIYDYVVPGCVFVLDEVWKLFPAGEKVNKVPEPFKKLLAEHRHMVDAAGNSIQIVLVVQDLGNIGAFASRLVESTFVTTKLTAVGANGSFRVDIYNGSLKGPRYPVAQNARQLFGRYNKDVYKLYKSHTMSESATSGANEKKIDGRNNIFRRPIFIIGIPACIVISFGAWHMLRGSMEKMTGHKASVTAAQPEAARPPPSPSDRPVFPNLPQITQPIRAAFDSGTYRVVGSVEVPGDAARSFALIAPKADPKHMLRVLLSSCVRVPSLGLRCPVDGVFYGELGDAHGSSGEVELHAPTDDSHVVAKVVAEPAVLALPPIESYPESSGPLPRRQPAGLLVPAGTHPASAPALTQNVK